MILLFSLTGFLEILVFLVAVILFGLAVRFFVDSRRRLGELFPDIASPRKLLPFGIDRNGFILPKKITKKPAGGTTAFQKPLQQRNSDATKAERKSLQLPINEPLGKIAPFNRKAGLITNNTPVVRNGHQDWEGSLPEQKSPDVQRPKQTDLFSQKLQEQLREVQEEFGSLQEKVRNMEQQAWQSAEVTVQLEQAEEAQSKLEITLLEKEGKLRDLTQENSQLHELLNELQEKLLQSELQQQQLLKKINFLEEINADMQQAAEADKKLRGKMSRMAELESMIELMMVRR